MTRDTSRVFNSVAKDKYFRFHNNNDLVTRAPAPIKGYIHIGSFLYISHDKQIHKEPGFWLQFLDNFDGALSSPKEKGIDAITEHNMAEYLAAIQQLNLIE